MHETAVHRPIKAGVCSLRTCIGPRDCAGKCRSRGSNGRCWLQALEALPLLKQRFPIARAMMRVAISVPMAHRDDLAAVLKQSHASQTEDGAAGDEGGAVVEEEDIVGDAYTATALIQPGTFRSLYNFVSQRTGGAGRLDVVSVSAQDAAAAVRRDGGAAGHAQPAAADAAAAALSGLAVGGAAAPLAGGAAVAGGYSTAAGSGMVMPAPARARGGPSGEVWSPPLPVPTCLRSPVSSLDCCTHRVSHPRPQPCRCRQWYTCTPSMRCSATHRVSCAVPALWQAPLVGHGLIGEAA